MNMPSKVYVSSPDIENLGELAVANDPASDIVEWEKVIEFRRLLSSCRRPHADLARRVWELYEADSECRLPREYIALFQRVLGESSYKLRLARALIGDLLEKAGVL